MQYIIDPEEAEITKALGGKAEALAALGQTNVAIPLWFVLSAAAFEASLTQAQREALATGSNLADPLGLLDDLHLSPAVLAELDRALAKLCPNGEAVAVRSSAAGEDGREYSFAGQLESFLFVPLRDVAGKVVDVWRSAFSERVLAYRRQHRLGLPPPVPAVLIQRMVNADRAGVAFSADPVTGRRDLALVSALYGLGSALVSGASDADSYYVDRQGRLITQTIATKRSAYRYQLHDFAVQNITVSNPASGRQASAAEPIVKGIRTIAVPSEQASQPALNQEQIRAVAELVRRIEQYFGCPQDIEWAIEGGQLYLLQARPITSLAVVADPDGLLRIWDNSNIAESYPGQTTPLTFSFARRAYEEVYRQFCLIMGVPRPTIVAQHNTFRHMLGLIRGRIYYNLLSWYRVLAMLPGYTLNRQFMEQMMGVKESLPAVLLDHKLPTPGARLRDGLRLARTVAGLTANYFLLPRRIERFNRRLGQALGLERPNLGQYRLDQLAAYYRDLESQLLTQWDAPLVNDFFAMIFYGLLRKLAEMWCGDTNGTLQNDLLAGSGGIISAEPAAHMGRMARLARQDTVFVNLLKQGSLARILNYMAGLPQFEMEYRVYLDKFGDRCLEELKLESPTLQDDPLLLLRSVGQLAESRYLSDSEAAKIDPDRATQAAQVEQDIGRALRYNPVRRLVFNWVLKNARLLIRNRENLRFERTRLFGRARMIFLEVGRKLQALDLLDEIRDIFYLEVEEILGFVDGTTTTTDMKGLAALRKAEFERYKTLESPDGRFETRGAVHYGNTFRGQPLGEAAKGDRRRGLGCSPGVIKGCVRVVIDPKTAALQAGEILVAKRTDPGWVVLFPLAAGLLVEKGSLLSHAAIVARELGLPAVTSLVDVTNWLKDGDWVEFNGSTGWVTKIDVPENLNE